MLPKHPLLTAPPDFVCGQAGELGEHVDSDGGITELNEVSFVHLNLMHHLFYTRDLPVPLDGIKLFP